MIGSSKRKKKDTKRAMATVNKKAADELYEELETPEEQKKIFNTKKAWTKPQRTLPIYDK